MLDLKLVLAEATKPSDKLTEVTTKLPSAEESTLANPKNQASKDIGCSGAAACAPLITQLKELISKKDYAGARELVAQHTGMITRIEDAKIDGTEGVSKKDITLMISALNNIAEIHLKQNNLYFAVFFIISPIESVDL